MGILKRNEVLVLLGAGASVDAGVPHSAAMIGRLESLVRDDPGWSDFRGLYNYVRSAIHYAAGIGGKFDGAVGYNIERLVGALEELQKHEEHPLYPFIGAWSPKFTDVIDGNHGRIGDFRDRIVEVLRNSWIALPDESRSEYFDGLINFQNEYNHPLRVFTLNYDLCVELACRRNDAILQRGFDEDRRWDWRRFDDNPDDETHVYLYKLHGSTDWKRDPGVPGELTYSDNPSTVGTREVDIIFGTTYKLQYVDPFLFLAYEFRKWTLEGRVIIAIGYGFGDEHINGMLGQALKGGPDRKLLVVSPIKADTQDIERYKAVEALNGDATMAGQVEWRNATAEEFFSNILTVEYVNDLVPEEEDLFPTLEEAVAPEPE